MWPSLVCLPRSPHTHGLLLIRIPGAGIGGLALAMALHNKGISFTLYEAAKEFSAVGYVLLRVLCGIGGSPLLIVI